MEKYLAERIYFHQIIKEKIETELGVNILSIDTIPIVDNPEVIHYALGLRLDILKQVESEREDDVFIVLSLIELEGDNEDHFISSKYYDLDETFIRREIERITGAEIVALGSKIHENKKYRIFKWYAGFG